MQSLRSLGRLAFGHERRKGLKRALKRAGHLGLGAYCPCCKAHIRGFKPFGLVRRPAARCPVCFSLERHRLIYLYLTERTDLFDGKPKRMLHVAPEPQLSRIFKATPYIDYLSADLLSPAAMVAMDITDIRYPDDTFDVIYCSHVLEHVPDDRKAMREFRRVLKPTGWAILQVPLMADATFEDWSVTSLEDRERVFGQKDHVRRYGPDYKDRLAESGFAVKDDRFAAELGEDKAVRFGLDPLEIVYFCRKVLRDDA